MTYVTIIGNLTQDAELREHEGRRYVLLRVAENIYKKDEKGEFIRDENDHKVAFATFFHSVFVNDGNVAFQVQDLKSGAPVRVSGIAKLKIQKDENNYDEYVLERIVARYIDTDPFKKLTEQEEMVSDAEVEAMPF